MSDSTASSGIFGEHRPSAKRSISDISKNDHSSLLDFTPLSAAQKEQLCSIYEQLSPTPPSPSRDSSSKRKRVGHGKEITHKRALETVFGSTTEREESAVSTSTGGAKRSLSGSDIPQIRKKGSKKPRLDINLGPLKNYSVQELRDTTGPLSPLFFSNTQRPRPNLPARFSSSEAAAKMLSKAQGEDSNIKTVTLARSPYVSSNSPTSHPISRHRSSSERKSLSSRHSSEPPEKAEQLQNLSQIGITELLDQDDRPTFIVDLADRSSGKDKPLDIVFANTALLSCGSLLDVIQGKIVESDSNLFASTAMKQFLDWIWTAPGQGETSSGGQPAFSQGPMSWTCSTLRKRFRVVSGTFTSDTSRRTSLSVGAGDIANVAAMEVQTRPSPLQMNNKNMALRPQENHDYFGSTVVHDLGKPSADGGSHLVSRQTSSSSTESTSSDRSTRGATNVAQYPRNMYLDVDQPSYDSVLSAASAAGVDPFSSGAERNKDVGFFDWTRIPDIESLPPHIQFARSVDWAATSLGPIEDWSADLRQMVNLIMASPHPAAMYWGEDLVAIYNEAYVYLAGQKHPQLMGQSYSSAWVEIWDDVKDVFASATSTGQATMKDDDCLFIKRYNVLEETYFSWSIIPMVGGDGTVMGLYNPAFEKTRRKIAERRMLTLREVGEKTAAARDVRGFWSSVLAALECNEYDTPFVLLYSLAEDDSSDEASVTDSSVSVVGNRQCTLEGSLGVPAGHPAAPETMDLKAGSEGFAPLFREVMLNNQTLVLDIGQGDLPSSLIEGLDWRGFGDPARSVVICPIHPTTGENTLGFLVMGVNPRRPFDDDYNLFIQLLSRQLATSLASVVLFEEEIRRGQRAAKLAAMDRIELSEQLAARTQEAIESETKFTRMAEFAPVGMFIANSEGQITYCNDMWYDITRVPRNLDEAENWVDFVAEEDIPLVQRMWQDLVEHTKPVSTEFRFKTPYKDRSGVSGETWVLFSAYPETHDDGSLKSVFGSITNISSQKWAEGLQKKKTEEAVELKRQQENFIDITSHEMRNPLSAILQCADEIMTSLTEAKARRSAGDDLSVYEGNIDAAQTITLCAQHQKRIVDDVLTMSKIDSALLMVTPVDVQPITIVQRALKMFEGELQSADIVMNFRVDPSFQELGVDWVRIDPSRVMQVLINLTTNAIKFTTTEHKRNISVSIAASLDYPSNDPLNTVKYVPRRSNRVDMTQGPDWGTGEEVFILFSVQDTGRGLSEEEKKSLFMRFSQASPRTHVQYGGSGLGLFISRELTELQGGEIGVSSVAGGGSTFAFFVKARRSFAPADPTEQLPPSLGTRRVSDGKTITRKAATSTKVKDFAAHNVPSEQLKVLLVEDNLVNQRVLQKQLKKLGCEVYVANHGLEALETIKRSSYWKGLGSKGIEISAVLMDIEMPLMNGLECTRKIREFEESGEIVAHIPILAVSANARTEQVGDALNSGMDDAITKPFRITDLLPKLHALVDGKSS